DHHCADGLPSLFESYRSLLPLYDHCLSALITDLHERGLHKDVCVVVWGEFGRTPRVNKYGGRDHWPGAGSVLFSGGGLKMGQYVGATSAHGEHPTTRAYNPQNILATLHHVHRIDPAASQFTARIGAAGALSAFGHEHFVAIREFSGEARLTAGAIETGSLQLTINAGSLAEAGPGFSDADRKKIDHDIHEKAL